MTRVVDALGEQVYVTIDCDGLDPAIMPAVGTPEPGGLAWRELLALLRLVFTRKTVVAADVVELCPIPGLVAPNFLAARLVYKLVGYRFFAR
jgi:agmatinase